MVEYPRSQPSESAGIIPMGVTPEVRGYGGPKNKYMQESRTPWGTVRIAWGFRPSVDCLAH